MHPIIIVLDKNILVFYIIIIEKNDLKIIDFTELYLGVLDFKWWWNGWYEIWGILEADLDVLEALMFGEGFDVYWEVVVEEIELLGWAGWVYIGMIECYGYGELCYEIPV